MPSERSPIVMLGSGRCGSTLLQRILNTSPEVVMWGEHNGFLRGLAITWHRLIQDPLIEGMHYGFEGQRPEALLGALKDVSVPLQWMNSFTKEDVREGLRTFITSVLAQGVDRSAQHFGFKEIRYRLHEPFMPMWLDLFPETRFLFVTRDPWAVVKSMFLKWKLPAMKDPTRDEVREYFEWGARMWNEMNGAIVAWSQDPAVRHLMLRFEDLEADPEARVGEMFRFLDVSMPRHAMRAMDKKLSHTRADKMDPALAEALREAEAFVRDLTSKVATDLNYA